MQQNDVLTMSDILPQTILPECWNDETRLNVLFAPIRPRSVNPHDWDSKYNFWKSFISDYCSHCKIYTFKVSDLQRVFKKNGRTAKCLEVVVEEMAKAGECVSLQKYLENSAQSWSKWVSDTLFKKPLLWSYNALKESFIAPEKDIVYVHIETVMKESQQLLSSIPDDYKNKVVDLEDVLNISGNSLDKVGDVRLLIHQLLKQGKASVRELNIADKNDEDKLKHILVKFGSKKALPITDTDIGIYTLEQNEKMLLKNIDKLENEINQVTQDAKKYLTKGHRHMVND